MFVKNLKLKNRTFLIITALFWAVVLFVLNPFKMGRGSISSSEISSGEVLNVIDPISSETTVTQSFVSQYDNMCSVALYFDTMGEQKYGKVLFSLLSESGEAIAQEEIDMSLLEDKSFYTVLFDEVKQSKGRKFIARITSTVNKSSDGVSLWYRAKDGESLSATVNGKVIGGTLMMKIGFYDYGLQVVRIICWILLIITSLLFVINISDCYEKNFIILAFFLGLLSVVFNPFPHAIDESTHFFRSFMISQGDFDDVIRIGQIGGNVSVNYSDIVDNSMSVKSLYQNPDRWLQSFSSKRDFYVNPYMSSVVPVNHCFAAAGIFLCRVLGLPAVVVIYLGRLITFLIYVLLCYFAIKKAEYYKGMFFAVSTLPISIWLAASFSIDPLVISASLLYTSICLRHFFDQELRLTGKERAALIITAVIIVSVKYMIYSPILLMVFLIPGSKIGKKRYMAVCVTGAVLMIVFALWQVLLMKKFPFVEDRNGDVNVARQISYVFSHIPDTVRTFIKYISDSMTSHIENISYYDTFTALTRLTGFLVMAGAAIDPDKYEFKDSHMKRKLLWICISILAVCSLLIMASLYAGYTPVGKNTIDGIQPRYFIPIIIYAMIPVSMIKLRNEIPRYREKLSMLMGLEMMNMLSALVEKTFK